MLTQNEKNTGFLIHLSAFLSFVFPFGSIIGPVIMWSISKDKSEYLDENGIAAVNFNLSYTLYLFILGMILFPFAFGSFFNYLRRIDDFDHLNNFHFNFHFDNLFGILSIGSIIAIVAFLRYILIVVAAIKANRGEVYNYPLTINFIKRDKIK
ncbi:DUF4870 domain-containing protein [Aureibaculum sp. A20]|uniref:DUF4870 domain-containing protein n=1 Tax=Aureibaculum flavum TaxID=2795986 RepID=A0ABS0WTW1_9FLAO|nr:DUF4870 domain-containing protein [Aureibaculum flavum]MBJ2175390.1 DUF4870 domain-containing protein [Aureibaculum flavum]